MYLRIAARENNIPNSLLFNEHADEPCKTYTHSLLKELVISKNLWLWIFNVY